MRASDVDRFNYFNAVFAAMKAAGVRAWAALHRQAHFFKSNQSSGLLQAQCPTSAGERLEARQVVDFRKARFSKFSALLIPDPLPESAHKSMIAGDHRQ